GSLDRQPRRSRRTHPAGPPRQVAIAAADGPFARPEPRDAEPGMPRQARDNLLPDDPGRPQHADVDTRAHPATASAATFFLASRRSRPSAMSSTRSRGDSQPGDNRTSESDRPRRARSAAGIDAWVMRAG